MVDIMCILIYIYVLRL